MFNKEQFVQGNQFQLHGNKPIYINIYHIETKGATM